MHQTRSVPATRGAAALAMQPAAVHRGAPPAGCTADAAAVSALLAAEDVRSAIERVPTLSADDPEVTPETGTAAAAASAGELVPEDEAGADVPVQQRSCHDRRSGGRHRVEASGMPSAMAQHANSLHKPVQANQTLRHLPRKAILAAALELSVSCHAACGPTLG